ncbi:Transposon Ty3-G Gag-Pol polyprotein [Araneus ventricosus]|uniref:RNA-directed DNA polymerase n=1 Tax=Araneus ventricosus TaxID=182803 RepID=A0A4Y2FYK2_ARAVE|nr:Transposon Ty3-G Gag-Pol polyprotein [Araneus ventricosus]
MHDDDKQKTAIITPFGLFQFNFMTFGLKNAAQTMQRLMDNALQGLDFCFVYIDDLLIASSSLEEHLDHLKQVFDRLRKFGLVLNRDKCVFAVENLSFLGHKIDKYGITPLPEKVEAISNFPRPKTVQDLRRFLGMLNFFRRFLPQAAQKQLPLQKMLGKCKKRDKTPLNRTDESDQAFQNCINDLKEATHLAHPDSNTAIILMTDASDRAIGGCIQQREGDSWKPLGFFSRKLSTAEQNGKDSVVADALSRIESISTSPLAYEDIARSQQDDEELDLLLKQPTSLTLQKLQVPNTDVMLYCDISTQVIRPYRGAQFTSDVYHSLAITFGIRLSHTAAYHPQANGAIERWHRTLKAAIMCHTSVHWVSALPAVLFGLRTVFKEDLQCSPAEMVYGENLCLPSHFFVQQQPQAADNGFIKKLKTHIQQLRATPTSNHSAKPTFVYRDLSVCSHIFLRVDAVQPSLSQPYTGPYKVLSRTNKNFIILKDNKKVTVTIDRLKPAHLLLDNVNSSESKLDSPGVDTPSPTPSAKEPEKSAMPLPEKSAMPLPEKSPILTRTSRRVHFPVKYRDFVS